MQKISHKFLIQDEFSLDKYTFPLIKWDRIFFYGDLWAGKSTFIRYLLRKHFNDPNLVVRSPTYTYYQKYSRIVGSQDNRIVTPELWEVHPTILPSYYPTIYHFDLYRIEDLTTFYSIWWMEILENHDSIALIEWPELLSDFITPTKIISIRILENGEREMIFEE